MVISDLYHSSLVLIFSFAALVFVLLFYISAPYGKFRRKGWGPSIKAKWAWVIMEFPSPVLITLFFIFSEYKSTPQTLFVLFWMSHYVHRAFVYPFRQSGREKPYPFILVTMAIVFNCLNGFVNGYGVFMMLSSRGQSVRITGINKNFRITLLRKKLLYLLLYRKVTVINN